MDWQCTPEQSSHQTPYEGQFLQQKKKVYKINGKYAYNNSKPLVE